MQEPILEKKLSRRAFLKASVKCVVGVGVTGAGGYGYASYLEPGWVAVEHVNLTLPHLDAAFAGYRIAQISDLHLDGNWMTRARLDDAVRLVNEQGPDLIAITGDFVTARAEKFADDLAAALKGLRAKDGVVAVLGNHDHWSRPEPIRDALHRCGITDLSNSLTTLKRGDTTLHIAGVDDVWEEKNRLELVLAGLPTSGAAILLAHEPDFADTSAATGRFDLQISGHSHGGQVSIPFIGQPRLPYLGQKYPSGLYKVGDMLQYTNRGLGMVKPYVRFGCRPEVTVFTLRGA